MIPRLVAEPKVGSYPLALGRGHRPPAAPYAERPRSPVAVDGVALVLVLVTGGATFVTLFRFFQFIAWT